MWTKSHNWDQKGVEYVCMLGMAKGLFEADSLFAQLLATYTALLSVLASFTAWPTRGLPTPLRSLNTLDVNHTHRTLALKTRAIK